MAQKIIGLVLILCLVIPRVYASPSPDVAGEARNLFNQLSPMNALLGPLVDNAISSGNDALAERLEQLRNIIQEALFNLNKIITDATIRVNSDAEGRLNQLSQKVNENLQLLNSIVSGQVSAIDQATEMRIDQIKDATDQLVEALPIPVQPLPNVPRTGFALIKPSSSSTLLFVTGAGLRKGGTAPRAFILNGDSSDHHYLSPNGTEVTVRSASMGLVEVEIPTTFFPTDGQIEKTLVLKLREGNILPTSVEPSFPLLLCARLPQYSARVAVEPIGQFWETQTVLYPKLTNPATNQVYITDGGSHQEVNICASDADNDQWVPDVRMNRPLTGTQSGILYGLDYVGTKEHIGRVSLNVPRNGCIYLYAEKDSSGGGFATAWGLQVHQRRLKKGACADPIRSDAVSLKFGSNWVQTDPQKATDNCVPTTEGASESTVLRTNIAVTMDQKQPPEQVNLIPGVPAHLFDNTVTATLDNFGLVKIDVVAKCGRQTTDFGSR
jgi:hypothetical protein